MKFNIAKVGLFAAMLFLVNFAFAARFEPPPKSKLCAMKSDPKAVTLVYHFLPDADAFPTLNFYEQLTGHNVAPNHFRLTRKTAKHLPQALRKSEGRSWSNFRFMKSERRNSLSYRDLPQKVGWQA